MPLTPFFNILAICRVTSSRTGLSEVFNSEEFDMLSGFRFGSLVFGKSDFWVGIASGLSLGVWFWDFG